MKALFCLPFMLALGACSDGGSSSTGGTAPGTPETIESMEASGKLPKLDRSDDLTGPDTDDNGIRDDIDQYIAVRFPEVEEAAAVSQAAKAHQAVIEVDLLDENAVRQAKQKVTRATSCLFRVFYEDNASQLPAAVAGDIEAVTFNTSQRLKHYMEFDRQLDGKSWSLPESNSCEFS